MSEFVVETSCGKISVARVMEPRRYDPDTGEIVSLVIIYDDPEALAKLASQILVEYVALKGIE